MSYEVTQSDYAQILELSDAISSIMDDDIRIIESSFGNSFTSKIPVMVDDISMISKNAEPISIKPWSTQQLKNLQVSIENKPDAEIQLRQLLSLRKRADVASNISFFLMSSVLFASFLMFWVGYVIKTHRNLQKQRSILQKRRILDVLMWSTLRVLNLLSFRRFFTLTQDFDPI